MDIIGMIGNLISGAVGGNISGLSLKNMSLGTIGNTIAGAVGGTVGVFVLQIMDVLSSAGLTNMSLESIAAEGGASAVCGAVVTAIVGFVKNKMSK